MLNCTSWHAQHPFPATHTIPPCSATRQAGVVYLKNRVYTSYYVDPATARSDQVPIPPSDKAALKASLLPLLSTSPSRAISVQLANVLKNIVSRDFPDQWPNLLADVKALLASHDIRQVVAGCIATLEMVKAFRCVVFTPCIIHVRLILTGILVMQFPPDS